MLPVSSSLADRYRIERQIGSGGSAEVYLAEDLRHRRKVAVKVLRQELSAALGPDRFLAEIELTAALQHPHIVPLYDSGDAPAAGGGRLLYYVMPYVAGESLRQLLVRDGPLTIATAVRLLRDVADALAFAHANGVVHRDIKPENVMVTGRHALVTDFGIAKALSVATTMAVPDDGAPTTFLTSAGIAVGTPAYMSPEQAAGDRQIDHRSDIYSFGALAYELLAGTPPFVASSTPGVLAAHLTARPPQLAARRPDAPAALQALVARCLEKDPSNRWQSAAEVASQLETMLTAAAPAPARRRVLPLAGASVVAILAFAAAGFWLLRDTPDPPLRVGRVTTITTAPGLELDPALSPDGRMLAYVAGPPGRTRVYIRQVTGGRDVPLTVDDVPPNQRWPQWSPEGERILFQAGFSERETQETAGVPGGTIYTVAALGGTPRAIVASTTTGEAFAPGWSPDGRQVVFVRNDALHLVDAAGTEPPRLLVAAAGAFAPRWSPDGSRIVYSTGSQRFIFGTTHLANAAPAAIWIVRVADGAATQVLEADALNAAAVWTPDSRHLLFVSDRDGRRDVYRLAVGRGDAAIGQPERVTTGTDAHTISLSSDGSRLAYSGYRPVAHLWSLPVPDGVPVSAYGGTQLTFDREGIEGIALSRDGRWLAFDSDRRGNYDIWKMPAEGGPPIQLTNDLAGDHVQGWSPDGSELVFHSFRTGNRDVFTMHADGTNVRQVTTSAESDANPTWGADANALVIQSFTDGRFQLFLWTRPQRDNPWRMATPLTPDGGADPAFAPDGHAIAYIWGGALHLVAPDGSGRRVLVPAADPAVRPQPAMPGWSPDSRSVYYMAYDEQRIGSLWSVPVEGGPPTLLVRFDDPNRPSLRRDFATDGTRLYFAVAQPSSDIHILELDKR